MESAQCRLGEEGVQLDLVERENDIRAADEVLQVPFAEVRDPDRTSAPVAERLLGRLVGPTVASKSLGTGWWSKKRST